ncbi:hypothetical protein KIL84_015410 [Mauremys mutica]|uniref:Uncharacterized protein n=1 Tax=Mauremys mutica TaxID=74926 RepID=A0A9D3WRW9_9SAUR|nr:hypothetical protein KIL84_015410 [Mauremys mutica]
MRPAMRDNDLNYVERKTEKKIGLEDSCSHKMLIPLVEATQGQMEREASPSVLPTKPDGLYFKLVTANEANVRLLSLFSADHNPEDMQKQSIVKRLQNNAAHSQKVGAWEKKKEKSLSGALTRRGEKCGEEENAERGILIQRTKGERKERRIWLENTKDRREQENCISNSKEQTTVSIMVNCILNGHLPSGSGYCPL